jgi:anthranilate/para-aminobenzoate synthase component I
VERLGRDPAERRVREQPVLLDVRDRDADLVDVADDRERRAVVAGADAREGGAERIGGDLRETRRRLAPHTRGLLLVPGRAGRLEKRSQEFGGGHGLRIEAAGHTLTGDDLPDPDLVGLAPRAGREPARVARRRRTRPHRPTRPEEGRFSYPMTTTVDTTLITPLAAYLDLRARGRAAFLLESVERGRLGRYSLVGCGDRIVSFEEAELLAEPVVGYLAYDHVARLEPTVPLPDAGHGFPESRFVVADVLLRFDHLLGVAEVLAGPDELGLIRRGDAFQIVLSQRAERRTSADAVALYRALRRVNPSPYLFLLELDGLALVGSSPETLVKREGDRASVNPIAGSTSPGEGDAERLLSSGKDRSEHVMLVDLGRNDLSRVCVPGTVRVERFLEAERFSHISHLVSEVAGELRAGVSSFDLLRATFPAGTVSGAPKVRAMQIISELEGFRRGPYAGAVLYALPDGTLDACIAIRTIVLHEGRALLQAGAGIVADSDPAAEHDECLRKLAALEAAIDLAEATA